MRCRHCRDTLVSIFLDLGSSPPSNAYLTAERMTGPETWYPLRVMVCDNCQLVQTEDFASADELFDAEYAYFSGFSSSWVAHCERYATEMIDRFCLDADSRVVEAASNDGTLLRFFHDRGMQCTGIEPTTGPASAARGLGLHVLEEFLTRTSADRLVSEGLVADLLMANNVVAHVPDIDDFVDACGRLLAPDGVATFEFPHLVRLVAGGQFDTIYHEHFSYLSLTVICRIAESVGLVVFDVEELPTHGGSLRVFLQRVDAGVHPFRETVSTMLSTEMDAGLGGRDFYAGFQERTDRIKDDLLRFLLEARRDGRTVVGYGAAAKGNTLLNYAGIRSDLLRFVVDQNPAKQGRYLPGSRIPVVSEDFLNEARPDHVLILPWNLREEVEERLAYIRQWGATFAIAVPNLSIW